MRKFTSLPRPVLLTVATLFAAATLLYSAMWMYYARSEPKAQLGIRYDYSAQNASLSITRVVAGSGAERAGLRPGDQVVAINGRRLDTLAPFWDALVPGQPGDVVALTVQRPGIAAEFTLRAVLGPRPEGGTPPTPAQAAAEEMIKSYPVLFLVVGLAVLFLRLEDRNAWLLALLFGGFIAGAPLLPMEALIHPNLRGFAVAYKVVFNGLSPATFYYLFAVFPVASPLDRRLPWLKFVLLGGAAAVAVSLGLSAWWAGGFQPLLGLAQRWGEKLVFGPLLAYVFGAFGLGLVSLVWNGLRAPTTEARRKIRVIVWGAIVGVTPLLLLNAAAAYTQRDPYREFPFWVWAPCVLAIFALPLSFAYAVVRHRVLDIPVLLKRSARYLLVQRGFFVLLSLLTIALTGLMARNAALAFGQSPEVAVPIGFLLGTALGIILAVFVPEMGKQVTRRLDRAFFRSAYDARQILLDLGERIQVATNREGLATLLRVALKQALYPKSRAVYLETAEGRLEAVRSRVPPGLETLASDWPLLAELARRGRPWDVPPETNRPAALSPLAPLEPECLVPMLGRDGRLVGLLVLGERLSEEPYSREDKQLLASVATQAATALENIRMAEQMAERLEAERRVTQEIEIAKQVQARLFPQKQPPLETLEYAGGCIQARAVGGDYYDFVDLGPGRVGLVLADIAGKGISAALLMANLQAHLRSQYALALEDLPRLLVSVNQQFCESTDASHFATLFFATYEDARRRLRYVNCGHNPPLLVRRTGQVDKLGATAIVLGLFQPWQCSLAEAELAPGDTLVIYSDGVTDAATDAGEQFGEARLLETIQAHRHRPAAELLQAIVTTIQQFSGREQEDDLTLVVAHAR